MNYTKSTIKDKEGSDKRIRSEGWREEQSWNLQKIFRYGIN